MEINNYDSICEAISNKVNIGFDYRDQKEKNDSLRYVSPHFIFKTKNGSLELKAKYIGGHSRSGIAEGDIRNYSLEKIRNIVITDDSFQVDDKLRPKTQSLKIECSIF